MSRDSVESPEQQAPPSATKAFDNKAFEEYLPLVRRIAMRLVRSLPSTVSIDDVISAGWVGLSESLKRSPEGMSKSDFEAYASYRIRGAILDYLRSLDPLTRRLRGAWRKISQVVVEFTRAHARLPDEEEIANELGLTLDAYRDLLFEITDAGLARLDVSAVEPSSDDPSPEALAVEHELATRVADAISSLPERLQLVLGLHYQEECTLKEIGAILGVSESRACQLHAEAVQMVRATLEVPRRPAPKALPERGRPARL